MARYIAGPFLYRARGYTSCNDAGYGFKVIVVALLFISRFALILGFYP